MTEENKIEAADLDLIPETLADTDKSAEDIWDELSETDGEKPVAAVQQEPEAAFEGEEDAVEDEVVTDPPAAAAPDIWASAPPELKAAYEAERQAREKAERDAKAANGRVAPIQRRLEELRRELQTDQSPDKIKEAREAIRAHEEEYPEIAKPVAQALDAITERNTAEKTSRREAAATELAEIERTATATLAEKHPDWEAFLNQHAGEKGAVFTAWVNDQPLRIREAAARNANSIVDADGAIALVDSFKAHIAAQDAARRAPSAQPGADPNPIPLTSLTDRRKRQLDATATPSRQGGRPTVTGIPEDGDPQAIWDAFEAQEAQQRRA